MRPAKNPSKGSCLSLAFPGTAASIILIQLCSGPLASSATFPWLALRCSVSLWLAWQSSPSRMCSVRSFACASGKRAPLALVWSYSLCVMEQSSLWVVCIVNSFLPLSANFLLIIVFVKHKILSSSLVQFLSFLCVLLRCVLKTLHFS